MTKIKKGNLSIDKVLVDFITEEAIPGTDTNVEDFWSKFDLAIHELAPINKKLIQKREAIQKQIDDWHLANKGKDLNRDEYFKFLKSIGYIVDEKEDFLVSTANVDDTIDSICVQVEEAIASDYTLNGIAKNTVLISTDIDFSGEAEQPVGIARLTFSVLYVTSINDVETAR